jgi:hypothetical protein
MTKTDAAAVKLRGYLADGPVRAGRLKRTALAEGMSPQAFALAKAALRCTFTRTDDGEWYVALPTPAPWRGWP